MCSIVTCLWKLSSLRALSSMVAFVRKSPGREPGRLSSSWIRWAMRACSLQKTHSEKKKKFFFVFNSFNLQRWVKKTDNTKLNIIFRDTFPYNFCFQICVSYLYSLSWRISTGSSPRGFCIGVIRFCFWWRIIGGGRAGCPGECVWGGITGEAAGGTEGGAGEGLPVGWGGISFWGGLDGAAAFTTGPKKRKRQTLNSNVW